MATDTKTDSEDYVVFEDSQGNEVSNDPRWRARKVLEAAGENPDQAEADRRELEELRAFKAAHEVAQAPNEFNGTATVDENAEADNDPENPYAEVKGEDLSALAKERGITIVKGMKAGDVRNALAAQDLGRAAK